MPDLRTSIETSLLAFAASPLREASLSLLETLGYHSDKTIAIDGSKPAAFLDLIRAHNPDATFSEEKSLFTDWTSADLLFQLSDDDIAREATLFPEHEIKPGLLRSYLFFAIELNGKSAVNGAYARGKLTAIARQLNRVFPMPVMVLLKHRSAGQPAVINRRRHKRDSHKDVLGKVTIIRDISLAEPHRGHLDILDSFAFENLKHPQKLPIRDFDTLHAAWEEIFNVELLNKRFYKELANWYFSALPQVEFPADIEPDDEKRRATGLIRLLTRLIFCWFLKEKGLIPEKLFHQTDLEKILADFDLDADDSSSYYQAILQNLFFATLNQRMGKDKKTGKPHRVFAKDEGFLKNKATYDVNNLYRYESLFRDDPETALGHFADIPFLNGGLFECLDRTEDGTNKKRYIDGFSRNPKKCPTVPNQLFFSGEIKNVDLSEVYHDNKRKKESVSGLIRILNRYKFTIVENTPIDQEIALDPELLGKVFENLLASYNEETKTTARKQTGSFYTPRPIVDYMVDESLKAHLAKALTDRAGMKDKDAKAGLDLLFQYREADAKLFEENQIETLLDAIHSCKILDPACGSGAFPMGMLHKLVYILSKLDSDNARWQARQISAAETIPDPSARDAAIAAIEKDFAENEDDYGRKLYLIESCLYGVDIQPIAIQITKLRFFISLVCDQKTNRDKAKNHGIRPLPNLETRFVAADTLIGLKKDVQTELFDSPQIEQIEQELQRVRHDHFSAQTRRKKLSLQAKDKQLRGQLEAELNQSTFADQETSHKLASWDPYDPHVSAEFFEPLWMFDRSLAEGFDVVIGNPPYISVEKFSRTALQAEWRKRFNTFAARGDIYCFFYERGLDLLRSEGILAYISSNKFQRGGYGKGLRQLLSNHKIQTLIDFCELPVFEAATDPIIVIVAKEEPTQSHKFPVLIVKNESEFDYLAVSLESSGSLYKSEHLKPDGWSLEGSEGLALVEKLRRNGTLLATFTDGSIYLGLRTGLNEAFVIDRVTRDRLIHDDPNSGELIKPWIRGRDITRWMYEFYDLFVIVFPCGFHIELQNYPAILDHLFQFEEKLKARGQCKTSRSGASKGQHHWLEMDNNPSQEFLNLFSTPSVVYADIGKHLKAFYSKEGIHFGNTAYFIPNTKPWMAAVLLSTAMDFYYRHNMQPLGDPWTSGRMRFFTRSMKDVPIPATSPDEQAELTVLAERAAEAAIEGNVMEVKQIEQTVDEIVYRLFDLTTAEIGQVESALANTRG